VRPGHHRPVGSITAPMRMRWHVEPDDDREPELGDFVVEIPYPGGDPELCQRAFRVVGVEEPTRGSTWKVTYERLEYPPARVDWSFYRDRR
jgi:hypothetical protein